MRQKLLTAWSSQQGWTGLPVHQTTTTSITNPSVRNGLLSTKFHAGALFIKSIGLVPEATHDALQHRSSTVMLYGKKNSVPMATMILKKCSSPYSFRKTFLQNQFHLAFPEDWIREVLLALYTSMGKKNLRLHVFGDLVDPDVVVSTAIAERLHYSHVHEQYIPQTSDELLARLREYLAQIYVTNPASAIINVGAVDLVAKHASLLLDGSFGEMARRQSFNRLLIKGSNALRQRAANQMIRYMTVPRAAIFHQGAVETMERGFVRQMQWYLDETASHPLVTDEDFVDLLTIRTRFPNYSGVEQARTDAFIMSYMPYLQPSVLQSTFRIPMHLKRKGRLFRQIITRYCPELAAFPLVKGGTTYPYRFSTVPAHLWTLLKKKFGKPYADMRRYAMLDLLKEYIWDHVHSQEFQNYSAYDVQHIQSMVERYYAGERQWAHKIDWWLSFEFWRQSLKNNH